MWPKVFLLLVGTPGPTILLWQQESAVQLSNCGKSSLKLYRGEAETICGTINYSGAPNRYSYLGIIISRMHVLPAVGGSEGAKCQGLQRMSENRCD